MKDLTKKNGCYAKSLSDNTDKINSWYEDSTVSVSEFIRRIESLVDSAYINVEAKPRFLNSLHKQRTKNGIVFLCYNSIMSASGNSVN